ncbi:MAG: aminotransferase class V-fold PLP-dependent enzyme, partial [Rickettsiales bacterium]|nr:aminotransferase class V-fold PLP-dependent enzyme [Rickettsiales bacterium]
MLEQSQRTLNQKHIAESHIGASQYNTVIGLDGVVSKKKLVYLDSTATALTDTKIHKEIEQFLKESYANTHTTGHHRGRDSTEAVSAARSKVGQFVGYDAEQDLVIFNGTGATGPLNYLAQVMFPKPLRLLNSKKISPDTRQNLLKILPENQQTIAKEMAAKPIVITTEMDH